MQVQKFLSIAIGFAAWGLACGTALAADRSDPVVEHEVDGAASVSAPPPSPAPCDGDTAWQIGLRAGWGMSVHGNGGLDSDLFLRDGPAHLAAQSGFNKAVNEVDLAVDVLTPWSFGIVRPFATFGVGDAVGDNENTGGITAMPTSIFSGPDGGGTPPGFPNEISGLTSSSLKDRINFYTRVGGDLAFPMPGQGSTTSFHVRPYGGFDVRSYTGTLNVQPSVLAPFGATDLPPDQHVKSSFTRVSPLAGMEFVVPLCAHECWGMDVYFGGEYQFDVAGKHSISTTIDEGAKASGSVSGGGVARGFAGIQYHFRLGGN